MSLGVETKVLATVKNKRMRHGLKQGTVSVLAGCHSPIHSIIVALAWKKVYGKPPAFWQLVCIFLHDVGHFGLDYLDNYEEKKLHWRTGARIARLFFGDKGYDLCAGHCQHSGAPISALYKADKYSWYIAPHWWLISNCVFEPKLKMGMSSRDAVAKFKAQVAKSIESGEFKSTHSMYLERCR